MAGTTSRSRAWLGADLLAVLVAVLLGAAGLLRLGFLADFISSPVLGVTVTGDHFLGQVWSALTQLGQANPATVALALGSLAVLGLRRWARAVPGPLVVVVAGIAVVAATGIEGRGVDLVGPVRGGLPTPELPSLAGSVALLPAAAGIALMSFIESISAARAFAARSDPPVDANRELLALGAANLAAGLFRALPSGGGTSQTAVNDGAGARTRLAGVVTAAMAVLALTVLAPPLADLPLAVLGAIILASAAGLVDLAPLRRIRVLRHRDSWLGVVALAGVLAAGVLRGVLVAVLISLLVLLHELNHPRIVVAARAPGLLGIRPEERLYFANARRVCDRVLAMVAATRPPPRVVLLDLSAVNSLEVTAADRLEDLAETLQAQGMALWLAVPGPQPLEVVRRGGELLGRDDLEADTGRLGVRVFLRLEDADAAYAGTAGDVHG